MPWLLATTRPNAEARVSSKFVDLGVPHHLFRVRKRVAIRGRVVDTLVPAFPRYLFVAVEAETGEPIYIPDLEFVDGFAGFVRFGDAQPEIVPDGEVARLIADSHGDVLAFEPRSRFHAGDRVRIGGCRAGAVVDQIGVYQDTCEDGRAIILVDWMGRYVPIQLDESDLEEYPKPNSKLGHVKNKRKNKRRRRRGKRHLSTQATAAAALPA